jgi:quinol monooxygenase YgiN
MSKIWFHTTFPDITPENRRRFEEVAARMVELTRQETGMLRYEYYLDATGTTCVVREEFVDSDAILAHIANVSEVVPELVELGGGISAQVFGTMNDETAKAMSAFGAVVYSYLDGFGWSTPAQP